MEIAAGTREVPRSGGTRLESKGAVFAACCVGPSLGRSAPRLSVEAAFLVKPRMPLAFVA
jgi:hypothetical protein